MMAVSRCVRCDSALVGKRANARFCGKLCRDAAEKQRSREIAVDVVPFAKSERTPEPIGARIERRYRIVVFASGDAADCAGAIADEIRERWPQEMREVYCAELGRGERVGSSSNGGAPPKKKRNPNPTLRRHFGEV